MFPLAVRPVYLKSDEGLGFPFSYRSNKLQFFFEKRMCFYRGERAVIPHIVQSVTHEPYKFEMPQISEEIKFMCHLQYPETKKE